MHQGKFSDGVWNENGEVVTDGYSNGYEICEAVAVTGGGCNGTGVSVGESEVKSLSSSI